VRIATCRRRSTGDHGDGHRQSEALGVSSPGASLRKRASWRKYCQMSPPRRLRSADRSASLCLHQ
jgi:hypothetical protein